MHDDPVRVVLSRDEALVLFELLARYEETESLTVDGPAEQLALWHLHAGLEKVLTSPLSADYAEQLSQARGRLMAQAGDP
jgi:hypothetical protein